MQIFQTLIFTFSRRRVRLICSDHARRKRGELNGAYPIMVLTLTSYSVWIAPSVSLGCLFRERSVPARKMHHSDPHMKCSGRVTCVGRHTDLARGCFLSHA